MGSKSRNKGQVGEREAAAALREVLGCKAERGRQHHGRDDAPDVLTDLDGVHFEVKRVEKFSLYKSLEQAEGDAWCQVCEGLGEYEIGSPDYLPTLDGVMQCRVCKGTGGKVPVVLHRSNHRPWVLCVKLEDLPRLVEALK